MGRFLNTLSTWVVIMIFACLSAFAQNLLQSNDADNAVHCRQLEGIPVSLEAGQASKYAVSGELCATKDELADGTTMQLLIHGATYNQDYWDFGRIDGNNYSYARYVAAHGFPTFALNQLGAADSSHPASADLTIQAMASVAHQIVQGLRNGSIADIQFGKIIIVGHSLGSVVVWEEAIKYADVDGVIITGAAHSITTRFLKANLFYPAIDDPKFKHSGLDTGYLTTIPNSRAVAFYSFPDADPNVTANDEQRKDLVSLTELQTGLPIVTSKDSLAIQVPVLTILGGHDFTTCGPNPQGGNFECSSGTAVAMQEAPFYSPQAKIHGCVIPDSGHSVNLAVNHRLAAADTVAWSFAFVGQQSLFSTQDLDRGNRGRPWNDGLPSNCGSASAN